MTQTKARKNQKGFSLLELLVAMTILAVIGTVGFTQYKKHSAQARHIKANDILSTLGKGLDHYYLKSGFYPDLGTYEAMIDGNSPLVKGNFIPGNMPAKDPWGQPYQARSAKGSYELKSEGDPSNPEDFPAIVIEPGRMSGGAPQGAAPAPGVAK